MRRLLLDTNVVLSVLGGHRAAISRHATEVLGDESNSIAVSAVSYLEIAIKRSIGKLDVGDGWARAIQRLDFEPLPVTSIHAEAVESLSWHHRDPFDRLLVAQALTEDLEIVSADTRMAAYGVPVVW